MNAACASVLSLEPSPAADVDRSHQGRTAMENVATNGDSRGTRSTKLGGNPHESTPSSRS